MSFPRAVVVGFVVAVLGTGTSRAAENGAAEEFTVAATAYRVISTAASFDVQVADGSELTYDVEQLLRKSLQRRGYGIAFDSSLVLTIAAERTAPSADRPWPMQLGVSKGGLAMRVFLLGPNSSGLLQKAGKPTAGEYRISLSIHDRRLHGYLWRGTAVTCQCGRGILASSRVMVPALVNAIGRTLGPQPAIFSASN